MATRRSARAVKPTDRKVESDLQRLQYIEERRSNRDKQAAFVKRKKLQMRDEDGEVYQEISDYGDIGDYGTYLPRGANIGAGPASVQPNANSWIIPFNRKPRRVEPHRLRWSKACSFCNCSLLSTERDGWCCNKGTWNLEPLRPIPPHLTETEATMRDSIGSMSRRLNNLFAISGIGVDGGSFVKDLRYNANVVLNGRTYHRLRGLQEGQHSLRWFLYDESGRMSEAAAQQVPEAVVTAWRDFLRTENIYVRTMEAAHVRAEGAEFEVVLDDSVARGEVAAVYNAINMQSVNPRTITFRQHGCEPAFVDILSSHYEPMQYPILFPRGEHGWSPRESLTQIQWYRRRILMEPRFSVYHRLAQEYLVDMWSRVEDERIRMVRRGKELQLGRNPFFGRQHDGDPDSMHDRQEKWYSALPASFLGSEAWTRQQVQDAMSLCREFGNPTLFLTMTTNPTWPEIQDKLLPGQQASDVPWVVVRVFHEKMKQMLKVLEAASGPFKYLISVVEFQKRGLPHCHILIKFRTELTPADVDHLVSAELPTETEDAELRSLVLRFNMHPENHLQVAKSRCNRNGKCSFRFPRPLRGHTGYDEFGRIHLRRRKAEDAWVGPYIPALTRLMNCHIYLDVPHNVSVILYLYKYFFKGPDKAQLSVVPSGEDGPARVLEDEAHRRFRGRYLSSSESTWRVFNFSVTLKRPSVNNLGVHLPGGNLGSMSSGRKASTGSQLLYYFSRPQDPSFDDVSYARYYADYQRRPSLNAREIARTHWQEEPVPGNPQPANYVIRKKKRRQVVGLRLVPVQTGELFYLRLLLTKIPARSFEELRTAEGILYPTFQEACHARGLLQDKLEAEHALQELIDLRYSPQHLRFVMAQLLIDLGAPGKLLWERFKSHMVQDFADRLTSRDREAAALRDLQRLLKSRGSGLENFGLPSPRTTESALDRETALMSEEAVENRRRYEEHATQFNTEQRDLFNHLRHSLEEDDGLCLFVDGRAGRGKSFVLQAFVSWCRSRHVVVLIVGSTALSVLSYPRGRTAHSAFNIPVEKESIELTSRIVQGTDQWRFLESVQVIIWEELPMINRSVLECVEILLRPIRPQDRDQGFGNTLFIGTGDFRQVAPVVKNGTRMEIVDASVKASWLWPWFETRTLETPVRFGNDTAFSEWLDGVGDGVIPTMAFEGEQVIDMDMCDVIPTAEEASQSVFPDDVLQQPAQCLRRAILSPINITVDEHNERVLSRLPSSSVVLYGFNTIKEDSEKTYSPNEKAAIEEWLSMIRDPSAPPQELHLKPGCVCALMRNLSSELGLVKNVRVVVQSVAKHSVTVHTLGNGAGDQRSHVLPRINFEFQPMWAFYTVCRRQFPLRLAYATTFNSCQGLTLDRVVLDMSTQPFAHGQLYTAVSRVRNSSNMALLSPLRGNVEEGTLKAGTEKVLAANIVYEELLF